VTNPVRIGNLFHLLAYAAEVADELDWRELTHLDTRLPVAALSAMLLHRGERLVRQGLEYDYRTEQLDLRAPRGQIQVSATVRRALRPVGLVACEVNERTPDFPAQRVIKAALRWASEHPENAKCKDELNRLRWHMAVVADVPFTLGDTSAALAADRHPRLRTLLRLAWWLAALGLPDPGGDAERRAPDPGLEKEERLRQIFEGFVRGFIGFHKPVGLHLAGRWMRWHNTNDPGSQPHLPGLEMDALCHRCRQRLVVECKFVADPLAPGRGSSHSLRADHVRQVVVYMENVRRKNPDLDVRGLLLYPRGHRRMAEELVVWDMPLTVATLDLALAPDEVEDGLARILRASVADDAC